MFDLLKGMTVLDLSTVVLGPFASRLLGDMGADVIKIEAPEGDTFRAAAPARHRGMGAGYLNLNRNKRSLVLNLKTEAGRAALRRLAGDADVVMHNLRPVPARKLGLDYPTLRAVNPKLVYCASIGFGSDGPYADEPAYDDIVQAVSGFASLAGYGTGEPAFAPTILVDKVCGLYTAMGILAGLLQRERSGEGMAVEAPMFESMVSFLLAEHLGGEVFQPALGSMRYDRLMTPYRRPYRTADGYVAVLPYTSKHWRSFLALVGRDDLAEADWVMDPPGRSERIGELYQVVAETMPDHGSAWWLEALKARGIPCGPVNTLEDLLTEPHLQAVDFFRKIDHPSEGDLLTTRHPLRYSSAGSRADRPAPRLGGDGEAVLREAGFTEADIQALRDSGAMGDSASSLNMS
jgi:crotonobetainyl-CoA:carnitine CoA-transferase CaiB-like acyl-CoA transferase